MRKPALLLRRLFRDRRGLSAVTVAVSMPVLFGVAGLGVDTGLWYAMKRQNQSAADAAALSAAYEVIGGHTCPTDVPTYLTPAATEAAARNNYGGTTPIVTCPYSDSIVPPRGGGGQGYAVADPEWVVLGVVPSLCQYYDRERGGRRHQ